MLRSFSLAKRISQGSQVLSENSHCGTILTNSTDRSVALEITKFPCAMFAVAPQRFAVLTDLCHAHGRLIALCRRKTFTFIRIDSGFFLVVIAFFALQSMEERVAVMSAFSRCAIPGSFVAPIRWLQLVNTTPQMTSFRGAKRVHKIATGKSYDELLQHDNKMRI